MSFWDWFLPGGNPEDPQLSTDESSELSPELSELPDSEIARRTANALHAERKRLLRNENYIFCIWSDVSNCITAEEELRKIYGLDGVPTELADPAQVQEASSGLVPGYICSKHESPIQLDPYESRVIESESRSNSTSEKFDESVGISNTSVGGGTSEEQTIERAEQVIHEPGRIAICFENRDNCTVSLYFFYIEANGKLARGEKHTPNQILLSDES